MSNEPSQFQRFPTTHWSLVGKAGGDSRDALAELLRRYWPALKAHLMFRKRIDSNEADDLVQGFIESKILERDLVERAEQSRGKFRTLLATALDNYVSNEFHKRNAKKRQPDRAVSLDMDIHGPQVASASTPGEHLDVAWAREIIFEAVERMKSECSTSRQHRAISGEDLWRVFEERLLAPALHGATPLAYDELIKLCGFNSPAQAANALVTAKRMFARILRSVVGEYADTPSEIEAEIRELEQVLGQRAG